MTNNKAIVLLGPTAVGKTELTEILGKDSEIINADSIQVYRYFDIASAKPSLDLQKRIKHHLVDILDPREQFTSGDFSKKAEELIKTINSKGKIPIIAGGTGFYLKELLYGASEAPRSDSHIREKVQKELSTLGKEALYEKLVKTDPVAALKINLNDTYRVTRALEVYYQTGRPLSSFNVSNSLRDDISFLIIYLYRDKAELEDRIEKRVDLMFKSGLIGEIKVLFEMGADSSWPAMQAIGYKEFIGYKDDGEISLKGLRDKIVLSSRQYAKRQITFFNSFKEALKFHPDLDRDRIITVCEEFRARS